MRIWGGGGEEDGEEAASEEEFEGVGFSGGSEATARRATRSEDVVKEDEFEGFGGGR